jgi:hypothetical protein
MTVLTTAEALKRYRDELNEAGFDQQTVAHLVVEAARAIISESGLGVRDEVTA